MEIQVRENLYIIIEISVCHFISFIYRLLLRLNVGYGYALPIRNYIAYKLISYIQILHIFNYILSLRVSCYFALNEFFNAIIEVYMA